MVLGKEDAAHKLLILGRAVATYEAPTELVDFRQELIGLEDLVRKGREGEVEVIFNLRVVQSLRLGDGGPYLCQVLDQRVAEVL